MWCSRMRSAFVTRPWPEPVSKARRLMMNSFSLFVRKRAVSGLSGRIFQITNDMAIGTRPSMMKIQFQPSRPRILKKRRVSDEGIYLPQCPRRESLPCHVLNRKCQKSAEGTSEGCRGVEHRHSALHLVSLVPDRQEKTFGTCQSKKVSSVLFFFFLIMGWQLTSTRGKIQPRPRRGRSEWPGGLRTSSRHP